MGATRVAPTAPAASNEPRKPIAVAPPPLFRSFGTDGAADSTGYSPVRWALTAAAALVAAFTLGYTVADGLTDRGAATQPSSPARVSPGPVANTSAANPEDVQLRYEIVRVPQISSDARESLVSPEGAGAEARVDGPARGR
jgi:hypothetical protein